MGKRITLTEKGFRAWLVGKPGDANVGRTCMEGTCPVAYYLNSLGRGSAHVSLTAFNPYDKVDPESRRLPLWAQGFVENIDNSFDFAHPITARQALAVLDGKDAP